MTLSSGITTGLAVKVWGQIGVIVITLLDGVTIGPPARGRNPPNPVAPAPMSHSRV